jgi:hypothetical protein
VLLTFHSDGALVDARTWGGDEDDQALDLHLAGPFAYITGKSASETTNGQAGAFLMQVRLPHRR